MVRPRLQDRKAPDSSKDCENPLNAGQLNYMLVLKHYFKSVSEVDRQQGERGKKNGVDSHLFTLSSAEACSLKVFV